MLGMKPSLMRVVVADTTWASHTKSGRFPLTPNQRLKRTK